ncbi:MAG: hypothetical protein F4029_17955 [Gammaproteobacteria bacterium]|nr:hypothetical protein [Gammaproteobacteria bacterium]MYF28912.1 hypothetical protein [Gammaproteobacteria bacterium]MYK48102.1 hypothetical protein [Gammaproteobacteria bacterium]
MKKCIAGASLLGALAGAAEDGTAFARFVAANQAVGDFDCSFTMTSTRSGEERVEHYSSDLGGELLEVDGREPTEKERRRYESLGPAPMPFDVEMFGPQDAAVVVHAQDESTTTFVREGRTEIPGSKDVIDGRSTLVVSRSTWRPIRLVIENTQSYSPAVGVKVDHLSQTSSWVYVPTVNASLTETLEMTMAGKVMVFKKISDQVHVTYSNLDCKLK